MEAEGKVGEACRSRNLFRLETPSVRALWQSMAASGTQAEQRREAQVRVKLVTKLPKEWQVPASPLAVPSSLTRWGMSEVVNHLLGGSSHTAFDFLAGGALLRGSLGRHIRAHNLSAEDVVELQYLPAAKPPEEGPSAQHSDWVAALAPLNNFIFSCSMDGSLSCWSSESAERTTYTSRAHGVSGATCASTIHHNEDGDMSTAAVVSGGKDGALRLWNRSLQVLQDLSGVHDSAVQALASRGVVAASSAWDGDVKLWKVSRSDRRSRKSQKMDEDHAASSDGMPELMEIFHVKSLHSTCVSGLSMLRQGTLATASWDHSAKLIDVETQAQTAALHLNKALISVAAPTAHERQDDEHQPHTVALGAADKAVRLWDTRKGGSTATQMRAHTSWVSAVRWCPGSETHLASASYDGSVMLWDVRAEVPLHRVRAHNGKAFDVGWCSSSLIASGGADSQLKLHTVSLGG